MCGRGFNSRIKWKHVFNFFLLLDIPGFILDLPGSAGEISLVHQPDTGRWKPSKAEKAWSGERSQRGPHRELLAWVFLTYEAAGPGLSLTDSQTLPHLLSPLCSLAQQSYTGCYSYHQAVFFQEATSAFAKSLYQREFEKSIYCVSLDIHAELDHKMQLQRCACPRPAECKQLSSLMSPTWCSS